MASAAVGPLVNVPGENPSFGPFSLTQFVGSAGSAAGGGGLQLQPKGSANIPVTFPPNHNDARIETPYDHMAQAPRPPSGQNQIGGMPPAIASAVPSRSMFDQTNASPNLSAAEAAELASTNALIEGVLGPNKDGRVRNPVPSKLKGKTDNKQGNFGVMHMGMSPGKKSEVQSLGKDAAAERDAAARKTSENTVSRAKAAQVDKYVPPKKRGLEAGLSGGQSRNSPFGGSRDTQRSRPLAPDETKSEQARLLTLLRSINPVTVVDQICKAVAYFGGIPGAPPPEDGIFPESANTRETGALFIGWLAEIFPDVTAKSPEISKEQAAKKKGRPSKGGIKDTPTGDRMESTEPPNPKNGYGFGPAVSAPTWGLPQSLALVNTPAAATPTLNDPKYQPPDQSFEHNSPETPMKNIQAEDPASGNKRRRGRPKGSRNKGKDGDGENTTGVEGQIPVPQSPQVQTATAKAVQPNAANISVGPSTMANTYGADPTTQSNGPKPDQSNQYPAPQWQSHNGLVTASATGDELSPEEQAVLEAFRHQGPDSGAQQMQQVQHVRHVDPSPILPPKTAPEGGQKRKRAPPKPKATPAPVPQFSNENISSQQQQHAPILPPNHDATMGVAKDAMQWTSVDNTAAPPILPPAKRPRQRKPKVPANADPPPRAQTASVVSAATPPIPPSTIPDSQATPSQQSISQSIPATRPPAEGLEAHYERFASFQQQQNGRSHTPTQPQAQQVQQVQQQARQQPKAQSVTPQHTTPQLQKQNLMQQQKSQQGQQAAQQTASREEPKLTQSSSARPSTNSYFNQGAQASTSYNSGTQSSTSYNSATQSSTAYNPATQASTGYSSGNQPSTGFNTSTQASTAPFNPATQTSTSYSQYPSHQPSQLYSGQQASPQLSNSTSNSYRTSSTHTLAQASPQFSQAENTYRTASPHTLGQPSPSFSQTSSHYRNTSTHNLAQQTPAVTQPENSYRTPSTHSMVQPTPTYTTARSNSQSQPSHQSHYNHFSDSSYIDLPTLESLGHSASTGNTNTSLGMSTNTYGTTSGFGQGLGVSHSLSNSRSTAGGSNLYGSTSGLSNSYDTSGADLLRGVGVSRSGSNSAASGAYGTSSSRLSGSFDPTSQEDMREQMMRGYGRR